MYRRKFKDAIFQTRTGDIFWKHRQPWRLSMPQKVMTCWQERALVLLHVWCLPRYFALTQVVCMVSSDRTAPEFPARSHDTDTVPGMLRLQPRAKSTFSVMQKALLWRTNEAFPKQSITSIHPQRTYHNSSRPHDVELYPLRILHPRLKTTSIAIIPHPLDNVHNLAQSKLLARNVPILLLTSLIVRHCREGSPTGREKASSSALDRHHCRMCEPSRPVLLLTEEPGESGIDTEQDGEERGKE